MDDDSMPLPSHVSVRNGVYQYVRRVPDDIADAFAAKRIQRSLKTRLPSEARLRAAQLDQDIERQFADARRRRGLSLDPVLTADWTWPDWQKVVEWLTATWLREDQSARLKKATGAHFSADHRHEPLWLDDRLLRSQLDRRARLLRTTLADYAKERSAWLNISMIPLGVTVPPSEPYRSDFFAACLRAEIEALEVMFRREGGERVEHQHPDSIDGRWRTLTTQTGSSSHAALVAALSTSISASRPSSPEEPELHSSRSLSDCIEEWIKERLRLRKKVDSHLVNDMRATAAWFKKFSKVSVIHDIRRRHIIAFRDHLFDKGGYKTATINKKVGYVTSLMSLAAAKGWVESSIEGGIYIEIPSDEDKRDSYSREELSTLFASPVFTEGKRSTSVKAGGELQFWLPLIACCHGLISSEILQLGPDTVMQHPGSDVWCFRVTNAGGRMIKTHARERYVPIRSDLLELGIVELAERADRNRWTSIWSAMEEPGRTVSNVSNYFSAHWTAFARKQLGETPIRKSLYSFRHAFKDELDRQKVSLEVKQALLGHSDRGTTGRYGTKSEPRPVNVQKLQEVIDSLEWRFLASIKRS